MIPDSVKKSGKPLLSVAGVVHDVVAFGFVAGLLIFAPLVRGGNRPLAHLVLEFGALVLVCFAAIDPRFKRYVSRRIMFAIGLMLLFPLLQLIPLPASLWMLLPGHAFYAEALSSIDEGLLAMRPVSLVPFETESAWLSLLPPVMVFCTAIALPTRWLLALIAILLACAVLQSLIAIIQSSANVIVSYGSESRPAGTYVNSNHLAGFLEMTIPLIFGLLAFMIGGRSTRNKHRKNRLRYWLPKLFDDRMPILVFPVLAAVIVIGGLIVTRSRAGIAIGLLGILLSILLLSRNLGRNRSLWIGAIVLGCGTILLMQVNLVPMLGRLLSGTLTEDIQVRWSLFVSIWDAVGTFFPFGSGAGTFPEVYSRFHAPDIPLFVNHAHNDYLDWLLEGGLFSVVVIGLLSLCYVSQWAKIWGGVKNSRFAPVQVGAGIGLLMLLLHSLVEFHFRIPANSIYFAFFGAVFFHPPQRLEKSTSGRRRRVRRRIRFGSPTTDQDSTPSGNTVNPFAE